jgi:SnoaL-like domain
MNDDAPPVITRYIESAADRDLDLLVECFAADAVVADDGHTYRGRAEIRGWRESLAAGPAYTVDVLGAEPTGEDGHYLVTTQVAGDFPGSPVDLRYLFTLNDGLISDLSIAP